MMLEILAVTAAGLVALAWMLQRSTPRTVPVRTTVDHPRSTLAEPARGHQAGSRLLMAAPPDTAAGTQQPAAQQTAPAAKKPPKRKPSGPSRRQFLKWASGIGWLGVLAGFGGASLAFIWPNLRGGFGAQIPVGAPDAVLGEIDANQGRFEFPEARSLIVKYDESLDPGGQYADLTNGTGIMALYQKCVHLGCKVPWCADSQWWECPCHGSKYNRWGEWQEGPAPRGLDRFAVQEVEGQLVIDTSAVITGPSRSAAVLNQPPEGPHCVDV
jgi:cytochrome b6-f complex iron-sulfur subunit